MIGNYMIVIRCVPKTFIKLIFRVITCDIVSHSNNKLIHIINLLSVFTLRIRIQKY